ncbi:hypothetical protein BGX30_007262 [Mortierella sp. GBA39]|nr:hypothetical protein BGX30_007262 [Mortierella sp. GBA39]
MTDRLLGTATGPPSTSREAQNTEFIVDIPLAVLRTRFLGPEEAEETESTVSHLGELDDSNFQDGSSRDILLGSHNGDSIVEDCIVGDPANEREHPNSEHDDSTTAPEFSMNQEGYVTIDIDSNTETQRIEWEVPMGDIPHDSYELVLGISSKNLNLKAVDSIAFDYVYGIPQRLSHPSEVIPSLTLETLFATPTVLGHDSSVIAQGEEASNGCSATGMSGESTAAQSDDNSATVQTGAGDSHNAVGGDGSDNLHSVEVLTILRWKLHNPITVDSELAGTIRVIMTIESWKGVPLDPGVIGLHFLELHHDSITVYRDGNGIYAALLMYSTLGQRLELYRIDQDRHCSLLTAFWTLSTSETTDYDISVSWDGSQIVEHLRRERLVLLSRDRGYVSTWSYKKETPIAAMDIPSTASDNPYIVACLSECGSLFVMATRRHIDVYLTETWTRLGSWYLPVAEQMDISDVYFTGESEYITVNTSSNPAPVIHPQGYVVDIVTMTTMNRIHCRNLHPHSLYALDSVDRSAPILLYQTLTTLGAIPYVDREVRSFTKAATLCTDVCTSALFSQPLSPPIFEAEVVERTAGPWDRQMTRRFISITARILTDVAVEVMSVPLPKGSELLSLKWTLVDNHYFLVVAMSSLVVVWKIPATLDGEYELLLVKETTTDADWRICLHHQLHRHDRVTSIITATNLLDPRIHNLTGFQGGIVQLSRIFKDADNKSKRGIIRHVGRHINHDLDSKDNPATVLTRLCTSWSPEYHEHLLAFIHALFGSASFRWIPTTGMDRETNPISILLGNLDSDVMVMDIVEVMVSFNVRQAKADSDLRFLYPMFVVMTAALQFSAIDSDLLSRVLRSFAYFPARDYHFVADHHTLIKSKYHLRQRNEDLKQHNLILKLSNANLGNPAIAALVQSKWTDFGEMLCYIKVIFYSYIANVYLFAIGREHWDEYSFYTFIKITSLIMSWLFALDSVRDLVVMSTLKMTSHENPHRRDCNDYFAGKHVDSRLEPSSVYLVFQQTFYFSAAVGGFLSVLRRAFRSIKVLLAIFAYIIVAFSLVFFYLQYEICVGETCPKDAEDPSITILTTMSSTYFMTAGMYGLVEEKIKDGAWVLHCVMVCFLFVVTVMLNILFGMVTHAFENDDRISELEWVENRMLFVARAENTLAGILFSRVPRLTDMVYYTASPQDVRKYRLETQRLTKEAADAALPLEDKVQVDATVAGEPIEHVTTTAQHSVQQQALVDRLKEDMKAEFKEELREQLEEQKRQSDEQIVQLQAQLSEILTVLRAGSRGG